MYEIFLKPFPEINLGNIILREMNDNDAEDYLSYMQHQEMEDFLTEDNLPTNLKEAIEEVRYWSSLFQNRQSIYWGIALKDSNKLIGTIGFNSVSIANSRAEISYELSHDYWGRGIMLRSLKAVLKFADTYFKLAKIQATVITSNGRSIKLIERCNFQNEEMLEKYQMIKGEYKDYYLYVRNRA